MQAGRLNKRVTIQSRATTTDAYGEDVVTGWTTVAMVWAAVEPLQGREFWAQQQIQSEVTTRVRIRYLSGVVPEMRVLYGSRALDIKSVIDPRERHAEMQLMCAEGVTDG